jgi:hypothetical protein
MRITTAVTTVILAVSLPAVAVAAPCPKRFPGQAYPWSSEELRKDDTWGKFRIPLDAKGRPTDCRWLAGNAKGDMRFFMCRALIAQGEFKPGMENGVPVPSSVDRLLRLPGRTSKREEAKARKEFFKNNPHERPTCYP